MVLFNYPWLDIFQVKSYGQLNGSFNMYKLNITSDNLLIYIDLLLYE